MRVLRTLCCAVVCVMALASCGGGGGDDAPIPLPPPPPSISLSPTAIAFEVTQNLTTADQDVIATYVGESAQLTLVPGQLQFPSWFHYSFTQLAPGQTRFRFNVFSTLAPGDYQATFRLNSMVAGSVAASANLTITLRILRPFALSQAAQTFDGIFGGTTATLTNTPLTISGERLAWRAVATQPWIQLGAASGNAEGALPFTVSVVNLNVGLHTGEIRITDDLSGRTLTASVQLWVRPPQLVTSESSFTFNVDSNTVPTQIVRQLTIGDELGGQRSDLDYQWTLASNSPLVRVSTTSGRTSPASVNVTLTLDPTVLNGIRSGTVATTLDLVFSRPGSASTQRLLPVTVVVRLPLATSAAPFVISPGSAGTVTVIGDGFQPSDMPLVRLAGNVPTAVRFISAKQLDIDYPSLPVGQYAIAFQNALGMSRSIAEVAVVTSSTVGVGEISVISGPKGRLLYDDAHEVLYATDYAAGEIQRFQWNNNAFGTLSPVAVPYIRDIALARNGRQLHAVSYQGFYTIDATAANPSGVLTIPTSQTGCSGALHTVVIPENAVALAGSFGGFCSKAGQVSSMASIDLISMQPDVVQITGNDLMFNAVTLGLSRAGRYLALGSSDTSGGGYALFDIRTQQLLDSGTYSDYFWYYYFTLDTDDAGSRVLVNSRSIRNRSGNTVCNLPTASVARLSRNGDKVYAYLHANAGAGRIAVFDAVTTSATCTELVSEGFAVPFDLGVPQSTDDRNPDFAMTLSSDETRIFLSGPSRIVSLSVN